LQEREQAADPSTVVRPQVRFTGKNYEVTGLKAFLSVLLGYIRMFCFMILIAGEFFFNQFGGVTAFPKVVQDTYKYIQENKWQFGLAVFFLSSII